MNKALLNLLSCDGYKLAHKEQYPEGTTLIFSNLTPRDDKWSKTKDGKVYVFGLDYHITKLIKDWDMYFFKATPQEKDNLFWEYHAFIKSYLGVTHEQTLNYTEKFIDLYNLGYLPLEFRIVPEGLHDIKKPIMTIHNTHPDYAWLVNFLETRLSADIWQTITSATVAYKIKKILITYGKETDNSNYERWLPYASHDFSMRGMSSIESGINSGLGHLVHFSGSDTLTAVIEYETFYGQKKDSITGVVATEHSVMSAGGKENELETYKRLLELYPNQILSIVSDTWNLWNVLDNILPSLKDLIIKRDLPLVIRPDSGEPIDIICGNSSNKGVLERLWEHFGGTINEQGFKVLHHSVRVIYGDSITLDNLKPILERMRELGFAATNLTFGVGSFTYQYNTRDTYGFAMKSTYCEINGVGRALSKNPITDGGIKKSATGLLAIIDNQLIENATWEQVKDSNNNLKLYNIYGII